MCTSVWDRVVDYHLPLANGIIREQKQSGCDTPQHRSKGENKLSPTRARDRPLTHPANIWKSAFKDVKKQKDVRKPLHRHRSIANMAIYS